MGVYSDYVMSLNPWAYFRLGDSSAPLTDSSGNGRNVNPTGTLTYSVPGALFGDNDTAISFEADSYGRSAADGGGPNDPDAVRSFVTWIKTTANFFNRSLGGVVVSTNGSSILTIGLTGTGSNGGTTANYNGTIATGAAITDDQWHMVAAVLDGTTVRLYTDGAQVAETGGATVTNVADSFEIAGNNIAGGNRLDEYALFTRVLTPEEVYNLYICGTTGLAPPGQAYPMYLGNTQVDKLYLGNTQIT